MVLIIDDEPSFIARMTDYLEDRFDVSSALSGREGLKKVGEVLPDVVLLDYQLGGDYDGLDVLREIKSRWIYSNVILVSSYLDEKIVSEAERLGVDECIPKNLKLDAFDRLILRAIERNLASRKSQLDERSREEQEIVPVFESPAMREVLASVERFRNLDENIFITGPAGSGKEVLAHWIHFTSNRADEPFCVVDLVNLAPAQFEEELFGRENGAADGAGKIARGLLELAHGGTIVLDEIGDLPLAAQTKLLRAVEKKRERQDDQGRCAVHYSHLEGPPGDGARGHVQIGALLPDKYASDRYAAALEKEGGYPAPREANARHFRREVPQGHPRYRRGR
jgi:DNA-binding NtrC family response regulator